MYALITAHSARLTMDAPKAQDDDDDGLCADPRAAVHDARADGPAIPSLDDNKPVDETLGQVAQAPTSAIRVTTIADLDRELVSNIPFSQARAITYVCTRVTIHTLQTVWRTWYMYACY